MLSSLWGSSSSSNNNAASSSSAAQHSGPVGAVHGPKERLSNPDATFGPLTSQDTSWLCAGGFTTETQTFYAMTEGETPKLIMAQVIHSAVGMWYPQIQFTFRLYDPATGRTEWRSANVTNFAAPPAAGSSKGVSYDKRSCKSDQFSILLDPASPDTYAIEGSYDANTQVSFKFKRADGAPGWKLGPGAKGGITYFGNEKSASSSKDPGSPDFAAATDGFVVHHFWPRCTVSGIIRLGNEIISLDNSTSRGIFIHAIQGMRPNLIACRWNFGYFNSTDVKEGVSLVMMEFITPYNYGNKSVTIGSVVVDDKLVAVVADCTVQDQATEPVDADTGYRAPGKILFKWNSAKSLLPTVAGKEPGTVSAEIALDLTPTGAESAPKSAAPGARGFRGLIEKVDVLAQIPYLVKKVISYVAGTKPYIYQFHNSTTAKITLPASDGQDAQTLTVKGYMFNEASFISEN